MSSVLELHEKHAQECKESVLKAAREREEALSHLEDGLSDLFSYFNEHYVDFRCWEAETRESWIEDPSQYDEATDRSIDEIYDLWFECARRSVRILDRFPELDVPKAKEIRNHYRVMLSVDLMDRATMPQHMVDLANDAEASAAD